MQIMSEEHKQKMQEGRKARKPRHVPDNWKNYMPVRSELIPERYLRPLRQAYSGRASYRGAVKAKCIECVNFEDVTSRIRECSAKRCPIWNYRPFQQKEQEDVEGQSSSVTGG